MVIPHREAETSLSEFLKATTAGGLLFLLPLVLAVLLFGHAKRLTGNVAHPISELLTLDKVIGPAGEQALAILMLLVISIAAGLVARTVAGRSV
jgi:uncharacterized membrane protein